MNASIRAALLLFTVSVLIAVGMGTMDSPLAYAQDEQPQALTDGIAHVQRGNFAKAIETLTPFTEAQPGNTTAWFYLGYALHATGDLDAAIRAHKKAVDDPQLGVIATYNVACVHALRDESDEAIEWLTRARDGGMIGFARQVAGDSDLDSLRDDPRFKALLANAPTTTTPNTPAQPNAQLAAARRQFDFWVGEWEVFNQQGQKVGENSISRQENGMVLAEQWTSAQGSTGRSINFFDPAKKKWVQVWVDAGGGIIRYEGEFKSGAMRLLGTHTLATGEVRPHRATYTPNEDGSVRQFIEESTDNGATWVVWFDGIYRKKGL